MLYLAEVLKKTGFMGGKAELKLLACQRSEQNWSAVPGEKVIPAEEANNFSAGSLLLVDLNANDQIQRIQDQGGRQLVSILERFSRQSDKFKTQEEEIEQWKQSLTYQSQELNRREMEMESRREQLQQMEEDFARLEQQRQEVEAKQAEAQRMREEWERKSQELEGAWSQLRGQEQRLEERLAQAQQGARLDEEQGRKLNDLLNRLSGSIAPTDSVRDQLNQGFELVEAQQSTLAQHWQTLEQQRGLSQQLRETVEQQSQDIHNRWQAWHQAQASLEQARAELKAQESLLTARQEQKQQLELQLQVQNTLYQQTSNLAEGLGFASQKIDVAALETMPLGELEALVQELDKDLAKPRQFVRDQEEELTALKETIDELTGKIQEASEYDRLSLETELEETQNNYRFLDESLVDQRRRLIEREENLTQHRSILLRRQGHAPKSEGADSKIDLSPILSQIDAQRQQQTQEIQKLQAEIEQLLAAVQQAQTTVDQQASVQESQRNELRQLEQTLQGQRTTADEMAGRVTLYQEALQPIQDKLDGIRQKLEGVRQGLAQVQEAGDYQLQAIAEMRQVFSALMSLPEFATP